MALSSGRGWQLAQLGELSPKPKGSHPEGRFLGNQRLLTGPTRADLSLSSLTLRPAASPSSVLMQILCMNSRYCSCPNLNL